MNTESSTIGTLNFIKGNVDSVLTDTSDYVRSTSSNLINLIKKHKVFFLLMIALYLALTVYKPQLMKLYKSKSKSVKKAIKKVKGKSVSITFTVSPKKYYD